MSSPNYDELWRKHRERVERTLSDSSWDDDLDRDGDADPKELLDQAAFSAAQSLDFSASMMPTLSVRLSGESIRTGKVDIETFDVVMKPLQAEVRAALDVSDKSLLRLGLTAVTRGSVVLHFEPDVPVLESEFTLNATHEGTIGEAIQTVLEAHDSLEEERSPAEIWSRFNALLGPIARLTNTLDQYDLDLDLLWRSAFGRRRTSTLSRRGRSYASTLFERKAGADSEVVVGYVYAMDLNGELTLKASLDKRHSRTHRVSIPRDELTAMRLNLGEYVRVRVKSEYDTDKLNQRFERALVFVEQVPHDPTLGDESPAQE